MENNLENSTQPPQPKRRSTIAETLSGGVLGGLIGGITALFNKKTGAKKQIGIGAAIGAVVGLATNLIGNKKANEEAAAISAGQPLLPPAAPEAPQGLVLGTVPQVLDILVARNQLTPVQQTQVLNAIKSGRTGFAGEIAVADGLASPMQVGQALADQSAMKAEAAIADINNISQFGPQQAPAYLRANWGNNGVNPAFMPATRVDGMSAAANIAQNLVMVANANPQLVPLLRDGVIAAAYLTRGISQGDSATVPLAKMSESWRNTMNNALQIAAQANPQAIADANGKPVDINQFITARNAEIVASVQQTLISGPSRDQGQTR